MAKNTQQAKANIAEQYLQSVMDGSQITSEHVRLQVANHYKDLKDGHLRGLKFEPELGLKVIQLIQHFCVGIDGKPYRVEPWEAGIIYMFYGWIWADTGHPRFKYAYIEVGRGNKKSMLLSAMCIHRLLTEKGAEIYSASTDRKTAKVIFDTSALMVKHSPYLSERITAYRNNLHNTQLGSKMEPCSAEGKTLFAHSRPSFVALDELHLHPDAVVWTAFASALDKRPTAQMVALTNSGYDRQSVCWKKREYSLKVLRGEVPDDTWFSMVYGLDEADIEDPEGWQNEANWIKANPSLGHAVSITTLRRNALMAKEDPFVLNEFLRFKLSIWTESQTAWVPLKKWQACGGALDPKSLYGRPCFGGLDLSTSWDITAFVLLFPPFGSDDRWSVLCWFFLPKETIAIRVSKDRVPYDIWARQGHFVLTEGEIIDYDVVRKTINDVADLYRIKEIAYDPWNATDLVTKMGKDGHTVVPVRQTFEGLKGSTKRLTELILTGDLAHGDNPILGFMAGNVMLDQDSAGNLKPSKDKSKEKIDGISALVTALSRAMVVPIEPKARPRISIL